MKFSILPETRLLAAILIAIGLGTFSEAGLAQQNPGGLAVSGTAQVNDTFSPVLPEEVSFTGGFLGTRIDANAKNRMLKVDENDLLDAFERREAPHQDWQGEHVGKFLHAATLTWNYTHEPELKTKLDRVVTRLLKTQLSDGYLGTYRKQNRWTSWDVWVHKYDLLGLLTYYQFTRLSNRGQATPLGTQALDACRRIGDLLVSTFGVEPGKRDINKAGEHMGMAADSVLEPVVLLYRATNDKRYLDFAHYIVSNYDAPGGPAILATLESKGTVRAVANAKAYEMTSNFNGLLELYRATGEKRLLDLMEIAWDDIARNRLYITGGASSFEVFQDDYHLPNQMSASICETCVTVTWEQMNLQLLRLTGDPRFADELEKSVYNHLLAAQKPTGDDWAYYTPLEGHKPYDHVTTCCHSSGPRGVALIPVVAYMTSKDGGLVVNFYSSGSVFTQLSSGTVKVKQTTNYPLDGNVQLSVSPESVGQRFPLRLRIPADTVRYQAFVNGKLVPPSQATQSKSGYLLLNRAWSPGDSVKLELTLADRVVLGDHENSGKVAFVHGPLVLALDTAVNNDLKSLAKVGLGQSPSEEAPIKLVPASRGLDNLTFMVQGDVAGEGAKALTLIPYAQAGGDGQSRFEVWVPILPPSPIPQSLFSGQPWSSSRRGNASGDLTDDDASTYAVTFDNRKADEDWFAIRSPKPILVNKVIFTHGQSFHDGGWFDSEGGKTKPQIQVQTELDGPWKTVATLDTYPGTTATDMAGLTNGQKFEVKIAPVSVFAIRVIGKPASGDNPAQSFSSCAELQATDGRK